MTWINTFNQSHWSVLETDYQSTSASPAGASLLVIDIVPVNSKDARPNVLKLSIENTDVSQTLDVYIETRIKKDSGTYARSTASAFLSIAAGETREDVYRVVGEEQIRLWGVSSGAGLTARVSVRKGFGG